MNDNTKANAGTEPAAIAALNDIAVLEKKATIDAPAAVKALVVDSDEAATRMTEIIQGINVVLAKIDAFFDPPARAAYEAWKDLKAKEKALRAAPEAAKEEGRRKIAAWLRKKEEDRLAAVEEEKKKTADKKRKDDEALAAAQKAESEGRPEEAAEIIERATAAVPPPQFPVPEKIEPPKVEGASTRKEWYAVVEDLEVLPKQYLIVKADEAKLNAVAQATKGPSPIPGVRFEWRMVPVIGKGRFGR